MRAGQIPKMLLPVFMAGCAVTQDPADAALVKELALNEPPYFPKCVASESGTYEQRKIDRHMWWPLETQGDDLTPITDECVLTQP